MTRFVKKFARGEGKSKGAEVGVGDPMNPSGRVRRLLRTKKEVQKSLEKRYILMEEQVPAMILKSN